MNQAQSSTILSGWRLVLVRMLWIIAILLCIIFMLVMIPGMSRLMAREWQVTTSYRAISNFITFSNYVRYMMVIRYIALAIFLAAAIIIFWRKSNDWIALLASATLVLIPTAFYFSFENPTYDDTLRWYTLLENMKGLILVSAIICLIFFFNLFPDGKFALRGMSTWITLSVLIIIILIILMYFFGEFLWAIFITAFIIVLLLSVYAQVHRYRRLANPTQRQQIKWVLFAFGITAGGFLGMILLSSIPVSFRGEARVNLISLHISLLIMTSIPVAMVISIFRYRLWDIDIIIHRALVYGSLSATLLAVYLIGVVSFQSLIATLGESQSEVGIVISTLVIAALFNPLRKRIQHDIDHRFYREKYDAGQALARFAAVARDETDLDRLESALVQVVQETIQPETISLWMREPGE